MNRRVKDFSRHILLGQNLRAKATRGAVWLGGGSVVEQITRFARNMLLARLLAPSAFGAMAIVFSASSFVDSLSDVGLWPAVVQNPKGGEREYLDASWWLGFIRVVCIYALVFFAAPAIAGFYGNPDLAALLRITLLGVVLGGMLSPRAKLAQKEMKFGRLALMSNGGAVCGVLTTIVLSFLLHSVWALAIGYCAENAFRCLFSYIIYPGLPSTRLDKSATRELLTFSKGMFGLSFLNLLFARTDIFVLGKLFSPGELGLYSMAVALIQTPCNFLINMLNQTLMPAFSHVNDDRDRSNRILAEVTSWCVLLGLPAVVTIWLCGPSLLTVAYGARYSVEAKVLTLAACVALLNTWNSIITTHFFAAGRPELHRRAVAASAVVMVLAIYPAARLFGTLGGQIASLVAIASSYLLQVERIRGVSGITLGQYGRSFAPAVFVSAAFVILGLWIRPLNSSMPPLLNIGAAAAACCIIYLLSVPIFLRVGALSRR